MVGCSRDGDNMKDVIRLKVYDPDRFSTLCMMHLSFNLNLENEELATLLESKNPRSKKTGFTPFSKRVRGKSVTGVMNGTPLTQEGICQVYQLIEYLGRDFNITQEGLFRKSGKLSRQQELKELLNFGAAVDLDLGQYSVHECAGVLKSFLADLPQPLLTEVHYKAHCKVPCIYRDDMSSEQKIFARRKQIKSLQLLFLLLPANNRRLLQDLLFLLHRVTEEQQDNLMDSTNLAMMFAPHIMCPRKLSGEELQAVSSSTTEAVAFMIDYAIELFKVPKELADDVKSYWLEQEEQNRQQTAFKALKSKFGADSPETNGVMVKTNVAFCDRVTTNEMSNKDATTVAVAGLYAYVQGMPDCPQKKKLIKQFNKENGYGIDLNHPPIRSKHKRSKTVGDTVISTPLAPLRSKEEPFNNKFKKCLTPDVDKPLKYRKRKANVENEPPKDMISTPQPVKIAKNDHNGPVMSKYSSPFARSVLRASQRVKRAVMPSKNRTPTVVLQSSKHNLI